jgi:hypothetical protein
MLCFVVAHAGLFIHAGRVVAVAALLIVVSPKKRAAIARPLILSVCVIGKVVSPVKVESGIVFDVL